MSGSRTMYTSGSGSGVTSEVASGCAAALGDSDAAGCSVWRDGGSSPAALITESISHAVRSSSESASIKAKRIFFVFISPYLL